MPAWVVPDLSGVRADALSPCPCSRLIPSWGHADGLAALSPTVGLAQRKGSLEVLDLAELVLSGGHTVHSWSFSLGDLLIIWRNPRLLGNGLS